MIFINTIGIFLLCFITHFIYDILPFNVVGVFFPVNESIWEHMKMIYSTTLLYGIIEYLIMKKFHLHYNNFLLATYTKSIINIPIYLVMYLPLFYNFTENMIITFIILFISIFITNYIGYRILKLNRINYQKEVSIAFIIVTYIIMAILTFKAPHKDLFFDSKNEKYGINDYLIKD